MNVISRLLVSTLLFISLLISMAGTGGCSFQKNTGEQIDSLFLVNSNSQYYYQLHKPNRKMVLPYTLSEVSALSYKKPSSLLMIEDETGVVYEYDLKIEELVSQRKFSDNADYEGVELVGDQIFVLESDGDIYQMLDDDKEELDSEKYETHMVSENDAEGLGYDAEKNLLLVACKEDGDTEENEVDGRAIYGFDLEEKELIEEELFSITDQDLIDFYKKEKGVEYEKDRIKFHPSAIALHPIEDRYYILASTGKLLVVTEKDGRIVATYPILYDILNQPEGITFSPDGQMYISSEGEGDDGFVLRYRMIER